MSDSDESGEGLVDLEWLKSTDDDTLASLELSIALIPREAKPPKAKSNGAGVLDKSFYYQDLATYGGKLSNIVLRLVQVGEEVVKSYFSFDQDLRVRISDIARGPTDCYFRCACFKQEFKIQGLHLGNYARQCGPHSIVLVKQSAAAIDLVSRTTDVKATFYSAGRIHHCGQ